MELLDGQFSSTLAKPTLFHWLIATTCRPLASSARILRCSNTRCLNSMSMSSMSPCCARYQPPSIDTAMCNVSDALKPVDDTIYHRWHCEIILILHDFTIYLIQHCSSSLGLQADTCVPYSTCSWLCKGFKQGCAVTPCSAHCPVFTFYFHSSHIYVHNLKIYI